MIKRKLTVSVFSTGTADVSGLAITVEPLSSNSIVTENGIVILNSIEVYTDDKGVATFELIPSEFLKDEQYILSISGKEEFYFIMPNDDVNLHDLELERVGGPY